MVPTLALGIPGSATAAVILGGLQVQGLRPGPYLFEEQPTLLYGIFLAMLLANILFLFIGLFGAKVFSRISLGAADVSLAHGVRALPGRRVRPEPVHGGRVDHDRVGTCRICFEA